MGNNMDAQNETKRPGDLRDYLAAERTLLAWIRTGLALMGFGFVVARFGVFLRELQGAQGIPLQSFGFSLWSGTALIIVGVMVNLFAGWRHARLVRELNRGEDIQFRPSMLAIAIACLLALIGLVMAIHLISLRNSGSIKPGDKKEISMSREDSGIIDVPSKHSVEETVQKLQGILQAKGVTLFALVDHSGEAEKVGLTMKPTKLLIFGSPKAGTPLMLAAPHIAIDLPLKILVWEDTNGKTWVSYNSPAYLQERHGLQPELLQNIAVVETLAARAAE